MKRKSELNLMDEKAATFSFFDGYAEAIQLLDNYEKKGDGYGMSRDDIEWTKREITYDITLYGCYGIPIDFDKYDPICVTSLMMFLKPSQPSLDKSRKCSLAGKKGGRGNKKAKDLDKSPETPDTIPSIRQLDVDISRDLAGWQGILEDGE